jgi:Cu/Ag efflux pump CusA
VVGVDSGELWITIDPDADDDAVLHSIQRTVAGYAGVSARLQTYPNQQVDDRIAGPEDPVLVRVFGQDLGILHDKAEQIRTAIANVDGVVAPRVEPQVVEPTVDVKVDLPRAEGVGLKPGDVRRAAAALVSGITVGSLFDQQKVFDVVVWGAPGVRSSLSSVRGLLLDTPGGGHVRLADVADVGIASTPSVIRHTDISRSLDVTAGVRGRSVGAVLDDVQRSVDGVQFPLEYHAELVGPGATEGPDRGRLLAVAVAAAIGVFLLLQAAFRSWRVATIAFVTMPFALSGGVAAAIVDGRVFSLGTAAGLVAIMAIAVRGSMVLLARYQHLERHGADLERVVMHGSQDRAVPIAMTAVITALALLPVLVAGDGAGLELLHPLSVVVVGGLVTSIVLNLFVLPVLCARFGVGPTADVESDRSQGQPEDAPPVVSVPDLEQAARAPERNADET